MCSTGPHSLNARSPKKQKQFIYMLRAQQSGCPTGLIGMNTMPIFIYGVIQGSWKIGIYQILMTIMSAAIWYPFFKAADNQAVAEEKAGAVAEQSEE